MSLMSSGHDRVFENKLEGSRKSALARSFQNCRIVTKRKSTGLYPGIRLIPEPKRSAMFAMYAWKRRVDDAADLDGLVESRRVEVGRLKEMTQRAFDRKPVQNADAFWDAFTDTVHRYAIPRGWIESVFEGLEWDLKCGVCQTETDLETYCFRVGSTIAMSFGLICGDADGVEESRMLELAKLRGLAFQLTNILRDFAEDYDGYPKRVYLPSESFLNAGLKPNAMRVWMPAEACERFALDWMRSTEAVFEASAGLEEVLSPDCRSGVRLMTRIARETLIELQRAPARMVRGKKAGPSSIKRSRLALSGRFARV